MNNKNPLNPLNDREFVEEQLFATRQALFSAKTIREIKFFQNKLAYLKTMSKQVKKR